MYSDSNRNTSPVNVREEDLWAFEPICYRIDTDNAEEVEENILMEAMTVTIDVDHPHFMIVVYVNTKTKQLNASAVHFTPDNLHFIIEAAIDPFRVWEFYRADDVAIDSGVPSLIYGGSEKAGDSLDTVITVPYMVGLYHPEEGNEPTEEQLRVLERILPPLKVQHPRARMGRFMVYYLDQKALQDLTEPAILVNWWNKAIAQREQYQWLEEDLQIPWLSDTNLLKEDEDGEMKNDLYKVPCMLYALKGQITPKEYKELATQSFICGKGTKGNKLYKWLYEKGYKTKVWSVDKNGWVKPETFPKNKKKNPKEGQEIKTVYISIWEGHWMKHKEVDYHGKTKEFIAILEYSKKAGIIKKMNAFEYGKIYDNYSVDAMQKFDAMKYVENHENQYKFDSTEWDKAEYKDRNIIKHVYFADFEAATNEEYHRPYLICAIGTEATESNGKIVFSETEKYQQWGEDCGRKFLDHLLYLFGSEGKRGGRTSVRVYFHNLKYDFTFLMPYLRDLKEITKGGKLYSVKACYKAKGQRKVYIDFWDTLPIFNKSLKGAVDIYLTSKEREELQIQKEVFPYKFYTYEMFNKHSSDWVDVETTRHYFKNPAQNYPEFLLNLKKTLPFIPEYKDFDNEYGTTWGHQLTYKSNMFWQEDYEFHYSSDRMYYQNYDRHESKYTEQFNYKEYAIFYCMQDVRCLVAIVSKFANLLIGTGTEGVNGTPPFSMNLLAFRTASSIGFDYFQRTVLFKQDEAGEWVPRHDWAVPKNELRALIQKTIRGGRVMCRDNKKWHYEAAPGRDETLMQDYDAVSLYPSAMHQLWVSDGVPMLIKGDFTRNNFLEHFAPPEASPEEAALFLHQDGCIHLTHLNTRKPRHFPLLCIKDPKTKLNEYRNFDNEEVDTWVNAIDLFNLIDFQDADFTWDAAVVWNGKRHYEIRDSIEALFNFRLENHKTIKDENGKVIEKIEHPIQEVAKLMMNSIFGKSILKVSDKEKKIVEEFRWRKDQEGNWIKIDNWDEFYRANAYRIYRMGRLPGNKIEVEIYKRDTSPSLNIFGSNVLAMARRIIGRVMALGEDIEAFHPEMTPGIFYTDTDSMHIRKDLLEKLEQAFQDIYRRPIQGETMGTFHVDFNDIEYDGYDEEKSQMVKKKMKVKGAEESWFIMKKMYADRLVGIDGVHKGQHLRMKGIRNDFIKYEDYEKLYEGQEITYELVDDTHVSFFHRGGHVGSRTSMKRTIMNNEARLEKQLKRKRDEQEDLYGIYPNKRTEVEDEDTIEMPSEQDEPINEDEIIDI